LSDRSDKSDKSDVWKILTQMRLAKPSISTQARPL
jgi:hypothetical protein